MNDEYHTFIKGLKKWISESEEPEKPAREEAMNRIKNAYQTKNASLNLSELQITSLPEEITLLENLYTLNLFNTKIIDIELPEFIITLKVEEVIWPDGEFLKKNV